VEGDVCKVDAAASQLFYQTIGKVQSCGRCRHGAVDTRIDRLVSQHVLTGDSRVVVPFDVRGQRREAYSFEDGHGVGVAFYFEQAPAFFKLCQQDCLVEIALVSVFDVDSLAQL